MINLFDYKSIKFTYLHIFFLKEYFLSKKIRKKNDTYFICWKFNVKKKEI